MNEITRHAFVALPLAALLVAAPMPLNNGKFMSHDAAFAAAGGNGKGNGNGGTNGASNGQGGANNGASANNGSSQGNKNGSDNGNNDVKVANGQSNPNADKNGLGRLNAFMHASAKALQNAAPNSAIGIVAVQYRDALSTYLDGVTQGVVPAPTIDDAAAILAKAANKTLTPDIIAAINARLAAENPDNLSLASLANPTADPTVAAANALLADNLSTLANSLQQTEANQGLGPIY